MSRVSTILSVALFAGGVLAVATPAQAAPAGTIPVTVCGDTTSWYVNGDEGGADPSQGDRRPLATDNGLVFSPKDLIHHSTAFTVTSSLVAGTFAASPAPDIPDFFSIETINSDGTGYATLRWNSTSALWEVTTGGATHTDTDPANLLSGLGRSLNAVSFGVGYTNNPPGTVTSLVSSISFAGSTFKLACPASPSPSPVSSPSPSPSPVVVPGPGKTVTVTKTVVVTPTPAVPSPTAGPTTPVPTDTTAAPEPTTTPLPPTTPTANNGSNLGMLAAIVLGVSGGLLVILGAAKLTSGRRRRPGRHRTSGDETQVIPAYDDEDYDVDDYDPSAGEFDPALGGSAGESYRMLHNGGGSSVGDESQTEPLATPPASTEQLPPAQ